MFVLDEKFKDMYINVRFENKINAIIDNSGTGKSYLMTLLIKYAEVTGLPYLKIDYTTNIKVIKSSLLTCSDDDSLLVLYDNGDLTLTDEIYELLNQIKGTTIISLKSYKHLKPGNVGVYRVNYEDSVIKTRKTV